jgi:hypothetical protein
MESAPQSTINHNAVIEVASDFYEFPPRHGHYFYRPALSKQVRLPKGDLKSAETLPKSPPRRNAVGRKKRSISKGICAEAAVFTNFLEMAVRRSR